MRRRTVRAAAHLIGFGALLALVIPAAGPAAAASTTAPQLSWRVTQTQCVSGVVHLQVAITGAVVGHTYAIYGTSGLRASAEEVVAKAGAFTTSFTPSDAYGSNDAAHFSVTGDVESTAIGQRSEVRTISAVCAAKTASPAVVPSTVSTALGFDPNALPLPRQPAASHTARDIVIALVLAVLLVGIAVLFWRHPWRRRRWWAE